MLTLHTGCRRVTLFDTHTLTLIHTYTHIPHEECTIINPNLQMSKLKHTEFKFAQAQFPNGGSRIRIHTIHHYVMTPQF